METPEHGPGTRLDVACKDGTSRPGALCETPMYDQERLIPRGRVVDIPAQTT
jgi:aminomethyltransferase